MRRCDFTLYQYAGPGYYGRPSGLLRTEGNDLVADIQFATGTPNTTYYVRLIQMPRASAGDCNVGTPGVSEAVLTTDAGGAGKTTVRSPIMSGATGVWFSLTRPSPYSQMPEEFYTTDAILPI
jgi:hypothetical protein